MAYFYAYHSASNTTDFDYKRGMVLVRKVRKS
jgi:hypothetical protein